MRAVLFAVASSALVVACNTTEDIDSTRAAQTNDAPTCEVFGGQCYARKDVQEHGCGGGVTMVDADGWCAEPSEVCCVRFMR